MAARELIVFGSIVQDLVSYVDRFPNPGESVRGKTFQMFCGGKGSNQAAIAAILGSKVAMVGRVGDDIFGDENIRSLSSFGVDVSLIQKSKTSTTGTGSINVSESGENSIVVTLGANLELSRKHAVAIEERIARASLILIQSEVDQEGNLEALKIAKRHNVTTFFNPAPGRADLDRRILPLADIICVNENEAEFITGQKLSSHSEFEGAAKEILSMGPKLAIVTLGPKGAIVAKRGNSGEISISNVATPKVTAVDTTGAGDCFCGSLASFLTANPDDDPVEMVKKAVQIASISVQRKGSQCSYPTREELQQLKLI